MIVYFGDDNSVELYLQKVFPLEYRRIDFDLTKADFATISLGDVVILDVRDRQAPDLLVSMLQKHKIVTLCHASDPRTLEILSEALHLSSFCFAPWSIQTIQEKINAFKHTINSNDKETQLYIAGVENVFDLHAYSGKSLAENYLDCIGTFIMILDEHRVVRYINTYGCQLLGYRKEEIIGKNFIESFIPKTVQEEVHHVADSIMDNTKIIITHYINPVINNKGEERVISWTNSSLLDDHGHTVALLTSGVDITEQYRIEQKIKDTTIRQTAVLDALPQYLFLKDKDLNYMFVNKSLSSILNLKIDEIRDKNDFDLFPQDLAKKYQADDRAVIAKGESKEYEEMYVKDGKRRATFTMKRPIYDDKGVFYALLGISWDISEKKEQERNALRQQRLAQMGEMISMIAHQWRQPLTSITAITSNILLEQLLTKFDINTLSKRMEDIEKHVTFLSETIDDFRYFFKPDKEKKYFALKTLFEKIQRLLAAKLSNGQVVLEIECDEAVKVNSYENELMQVMINLFQNSLDAFSENQIKDPLIQITIEQNSTDAEICFCDNAGGVDELLLERIFEPYFSTKAEQQGTGIGLYMSKSIIEEHCQGKLDVKQHDGGLCFTVRLPL